MRYCHSCNAQFPETLKRCLHCRGRLQSNPPGSSPREVEPVGEPSEPVLLARRQPLKAEPLLKRLRAAGVPFQVNGEGGTREVNWLHGSYGAHAAIEVYVHAEDLEQAESVIGAELAPLTAELQHEVAEAGDCPACHYSVPANASECPDCGLVFPD